MGPQCVTMLVRRYQGKKEAIKSLISDPFSKSDQLAVWITEPASPIPTIWILGIGVRDRLTSLPEGCRSATLGGEGSVLITN